LTLALFVEGPSDKDSIPILIRKVSKSPVKIVPRIVRDMFNYNKIERHIQFLLRQHSDVKKILVCKDTECSDPKKIEKMAKSMEKKLKKYPKVKYVLVVHALESWLSEREGLRKLLGEKAKIKLPYNLEKVCKPSEILKEVFRRNGRSFLKTRDAPALAKVIEVNNMKRQNKSFHTFCRTVQDC